MVFVDPSLLNWSLARIEAERDRLAPQVCGAFSSHELTPAWEAKKDRYDALEHAAAILQALKKPTPDEIADLLSSHGYELHDSTVDLLVRALTPQQFEQCFIKVGENSGAAVRRLLPYTTKEMRLSVLKNCRGIDMLVAEYEKTNPGSL